VFWAHASNAARLEQSFRDIADRVKIMGRQEQRANIFKLVHDWLCDSKQRWLLILDNVDDAGFLLDAEHASSQTAARPLREYLPHCERGSILVTSRNGQAAKKLVEQRDIITLDPMDELQSLALLEKKLGAQADESDSAELAAALEYMPLAITQAAAYISQRAPLCSVAQYLNQFKKSERKRTSLLNRDEGQLRRDREAKNSIITTWQISFEHIQQTRPSAADLLSLMSFFDRQGIPRQLLQTRVTHEDGEADLKVKKAETSYNEECSGDFENGPENDPAHDSFDDLEGNVFEDDHSEEDDSEDDSFYEDVSALRNFCFISVNNDMTFEMHALVQLSMRAWLAANGKLEQWKQHSINNLCAAFPNGEYENWAVCQTLFAHAKAASKQKPEASSSLIAWATLLYHAAWYAMRKASAGEAEMLAMQSIKVREKVLGREHEDTLSAISIVAETYRLSGRWNKAEKLSIQVEETCKKKLGADHPNTLTSMANLASTYWDQGRWDAAEELGVQVMQIYKQKLGADHPNTLTSMGNLASTYRNQGRWDAAEELGVQVMQIFKQKLGADHPHTLTSMGNLASTYRNQGRWDAAEELDVQVMQIRKQKLGADHPHTLASMSNLGVTYSMQGKEEKAEPLKMQVMETCKQKLGADHPHTLTSMANLASTYRNQGRWDAAEELGVQVMQICKQKLGADHPHTLTSMGNLASTYMNQGRWDAAEELGVQVMQICKQKLGADHPHTLTSMANLAWTYKSSGRNAEAISLMQDCVRRECRILRSGHPDIVSSSTALAEWEAEQAFSTLAISE
jgi:precorrin-6x reductase